MVSNMVSGIQKSYERKLFSFFQPLVFKYRVAKEIKKQTDRYLASDFNLIELLRPDENRISDIIALLLNPKGEHGQGEIFLKEFIRQLENHIRKETENFKVLNNIDISQASVERELMTYQGKRIDIAIKFRDFVIGIENKLGAIEQERQLADYNNFLQHVSRNYILIYLDGLGREAKSIKNKDKLKQEGRFLEVSYLRFLKPWLIRCYKECEAEKFRWFLKDSVSWIENNFKENEDEQ